MYFPEDIWKNILSFIPDYTKQKQILLKNELIKDINFLSKDFREWLFFQDDIEFIYYIGWLQYLYPYDFDFFVSLVVEV
jgi:hypothetical protein